MSNDDALDMKLFHAEFIGGFFSSVVYRHIFKNLSKLNTASSDHTCGQECLAKTVFAKFPSKKTTGFLRKFQFVLQANATVFIAWCLTNT